MYISEGDRERQGWNSGDPVGREGRSGKIGRFCEDRSDGPRHFHSRCGIIGAPSSDYRNSSPRPNYEFIRAKRFLAIAKDGTFAAEIATASNYLPTIETTIGTRNGYKFFPNDRSIRFLGAIDPTSSWLLHELRVRYLHANYWLIKAWNVDDSGSRFASFHRKRDEWIEASIIIKSKREGCGRL